MLYPTYHKLNKEHREYESDLLSNEHHLRIRPEKCRKNTMLFSVNICIFDTLPSFTNQACSYIIKKKQQQMQ